jgi:phage tail sheath protein FI
MTISVFSFTLMGSAVQPCDVELFSGPFITYLREDDNYATLAARLSMFTGDKDLLGTARLAIVDENTPHFLPKQQSSNNNNMSSRVSMNSLAHNNEETKDGGQQQQSQQKAVESIWEIAKKHYPDYATKPFPEVRRSFANQVKLMPYLGIQRSSADVETMANKNK